MLISSLNNQNKGVKRANLYLKKNKKLSLKKRYSLFNELYLLLNAGLDLKASFMIIGENLKENRSDQTIKTIFDKVVKGAGFGEALENSGSFCLWECKTISIGEESGTLNRVLENLAMYHHRTIEQRKKIISSLSYPAVVLFTAMIAVFLMLTLIVPMFKDVFEQFGSDLPNITKWIMKLSENLPSKMVVIMIITGMLFVVILKVKKKESFRKITGLLLLKIPLVGKYISELQLARLFMMLELMEKSSVPLLKAVRMNSEMIGFYPLQQEMKSAVVEIEHGKNLSDSLLGGNQFSKREISLIKIAEETNNLAVVFEQIRKIKNSSIDQHNRMISAVVEPFLIIITGGIVAIILVAMYLPMFSLGDAIGL